jgi:hypothetical protein
MFPVAGEGPVFLGCRDVERQKAQFSYRSAEVRAPLVAAESAAAHQVHKAPAADPLVHSEAGHRPMTTATLDRDADTKSGFISGNLFRKSEPAPPPVSTAVVPYEAPPQPSAAPKATDLERQIRSQIWTCISPDLARAAGLSLPELIDWVSRVTRLSMAQVEALARKMGLLTTPRTGVDVIRDRLRAAMKKRLDFAAHIDWPRGQKGEEELRAFANGEDGALTYPEMGMLVREFCGSFVELDPQSLALKSTSPPATPLCAPDYGHDPFVVDQRYVSQPRREGPAFAPAPPRAYLPLCERPAEYPPKWS